MKQPPIIYFDFPSIVHHLKAVVELFTSSISTSACAVMQHSAQHGVAKLKRHTPIESRCFVKTVCSVGVFGILTNFLGRDISWAVSLAMVPHQTCACIRLASRYFPLVTKWFSSCLSAQCTVLLLFDRACCLVVFGRGNEQVFLSFGAFTRI